MVENQNFGQAIEALKQGKRVARQGWNGKGLFVFMQVPSVINVWVFTLCGINSNKVQLTTK